MKAKQNNQLYLLGGWLFILASVIIFVWTWYFIYLPGGKNLNQVGPLGDWVAGLTAPFLNVAGFFMIYAAFRQQSKDTDATRQEFHLQRFEQTFFQLLNLYHQHVNAIRLQYSRKYNEDFFDATHQFLRKSLSEKTDFEELQEAFGIFYEKNYQQVDHFIRHIRFTLEFVHLSTAFDDQTEVDAQAERKKYIDILATQLSSGEQELIFYHCLCQPDCPVSFRQLLLQYGCLAQLKQPLSAVAPEHWNLFEDKI